MKKNKFIIPVLFLILLLSSCATTLNIKVTRPAKLNLNGAKTIGVLPFTESEKNPFNYFFDSDKDVIQNYYNYYGEISRVERDIIELIQDSLEEGLNKSPYITLVNSRDLRNALKYGGKNPADVFIGGQIISCRIIDRQEKIKRRIPSSDDSENNSKPKYYYEYIYSREAELIFTYEIVDGATRRIISQDTKRINNKSSTYDNVKELPSFYYLVSDDLYNFINELMQNLQPYTVTKSIKLLEDKTDNPNMDHADKIANDGYYRESYSEFMKIYMQTGQFEAGYNAAMLLMALGELQSAESLMNEVYSNHSDQRALEALYDIRNEIKQAERLDNQINPIDKSDYDVFTFDYND